MSISVTKANVDDYERILDEMPDDATNILLNLLGSTPQERIIRADWLRSIADEEELAAVRDARAEGTSWAEIGRWFGITRQSAHERFADAISEAVSPRDLPANLR